MVCISDLGRQGFDIAKSYYSEPRYETAEPHLWTMDDCLVFPHGIWFL